MIIESTLIFIDIHQLGLDTHLVPVVETLSILVTDEDPIPPSPATTVGLLGVQVLEDSQ